MPNSQLVEHLNDALNREISTAIRYMLQSSKIHGVTNEPLRSMYRNEVQDEIGHAQYLADKIVTLGGTPRPRPEFKPIPAEVSQMMERDLAEEENDVALYRRLAVLAEESGDIELKLQMEEQAADEARHAERLRRMVV